MRMQGEVCCDNKRANAQAARLVESERKRGDHLGPFEPMLGIRDIWVIDFQGEVAKRYLEKVGRMADA